MMRCEDCRTEVEAYFDGELDPRTAGLIERHLEDCSACESLFSSLGREQELYLGYGCDARPAPAFWDEVMERAAPPTQAAAPRSAQLHDRPARLLDRLRASLGVPRFSPALAALMVIIAVAITAGIMRYMNAPVRNPEPSGIAQNAGAPPAPQRVTPEEAVPSTSPAVEPDAVVKGNKTGAGQRFVPAKAERKDKVSAAPDIPYSARAGSVRPATEARGQTADELVREAEQKYREAIGVLSRDVSSRPPLDTETAARFERTLAAVDRNIMETRRAVRRRPGDPVAAQYMLAAYSRKVEVLREMAGGY